METDLPEHAFNILSNREKYFLNRDKEVVERLLKCKDPDFRKAFCHIDKNIKRCLFSEQSAWIIFLQMLIEHSTDCGSGRVKEINDAKEEYQKKLLKISKTAKNLAKQIRVASILSSKYGFYDQVDVNPFDLINSAANNMPENETQYRFINYISENMNNVRKGFDLKYFPDIPTVIDEIATQYEKGFTWSEQAETPKKTGKINFFCSHFFACIHRLEETNQLPKGILKITDQELADILKITLDDKTIGVQDIKNFKPRKKFK